MRICDGQGEWPFWQSMFFNLLRM